MYKIIVHVNKKTYVTIILCDQFFWNSHSPFHYFLKFIEISIHCIIKFFSQLSNRLIDFPCHWFFFLPYNISNTWKILLDIKEKKIIRDLNLHIEFFTFLIDVKFSTSYNFCSSARSYPWYFSTIFHTWSKTIQGILFNLLDW